ncbi:polyphosphate kinase [Amphibacillus marinus]|uniref:Polyphosphate kinase n=1 Tax=Amphibacillus marinus TaxID=872970 RepID=A0A1H8RGH2_9BACI|nr:RNA degradosome polyphosphate kinase [Amphibacillus marinus]SEO65432.1 polyphosphate kinase [Amphibacillus marinus]
MYKLNGETNLDNPAYFNNREISWLHFNKRVLEEAVDFANPLLERLRFIAIFSSNLDEFFMVRVAALKDQVRVGFNRKDNKSGLTPLQQLKAINQHIHKLANDQQSYYQDLLKELQEHQINILTFKDLAKADHKWLRDYFDEMVFPALTPLAIDAYRPFPLLANRSLNIAVKLSKLNHPIKLVTAIVQVPVLLNRFIQLKDRHHYILLEDVIVHFIDSLFKGYHVQSTTLFRITRNADLNIHEEGARDLLKEIEKELKKRRWGAAVRLEVIGDNHDLKLMHFLQHVLEINTDDIYFQNGPLDYTFLSDFYEHLSDSFDTLVYQKLIPQPARELNPITSIFEQILSRDILLHHPYESFEVVVDFIGAAAQDPSVLAIKQTLYRVSGDSPIVASLKAAAENGKQVTVLVELKARFDEANNVQWAKELEKAGCHVIYGMTGLKTHSKITLIVKKGANKIERYVHIGTGNYNDHTSRFYTDFSFFTAKRAFAIDATHFFNYVSGYTKKPNYHTLSMAPFSVRDDLVSLINQEIACHKTSGTGHIIMKMNALTDKALILKLYQASQMGVKIDLIIRGICCLKPGIAGISEQIKVISIVGRFLEHSRIYYFHHAGHEKFYLSSADLMTRNMSKRIELFFPIPDQAHKKRIKTILQFFLADNRKARQLNSDGFYQYVEKSQDTPLFNSQIELFELAYQVMDDEE